MRRSVSILLFVALHAMPALADDRTDARAEMTAALEAQADTHPPPVTLPVATATTRTAIAPARPATPRASLDASARAVDRIQQTIVGLSTALARQTQAAVQAATGQAQGQAAKDRAARNPRSGH